VSQREQLPFVDILPRHDEPCLTCVKFRRGKQGLHAPVRCLTSINDRPWSSAFTASIELPCGPRAGGHVAYRSSHQRDRHCVVQLWHNGCRRTVRLGVAWTRFFRVRLRRMSCGFTGKNEVPILRNPGPSFAAIAARPSTSEATLRAYLMTRHPDMGPAGQMPNPRLVDYQIDEVVAYILSLRGGS